MDVSADYVIVGGGSAGCVLANRLSANGRHRVVLIEAGRDMLPDRPEEAILDSYPRVAYFDPRNTWSGLRAHLQPVPHNDPASAAPARRYEQARIMGGGSSLNDMQANRGLPEDYDEWVHEGAAGWGWDDVLPSFRRIERDMDFDGPLHGREGPLAIRRIDKSAWPGWSLRASEAFRAAGFRELSDQNAEFDDGYFPVAISNLYDRRVSSAIAFLDNATRRRHNLVIIADATLTRLVLNGNTVWGIEAQRNGSRFTVGAREVILCTGSLHSPAILQRAGIGDARHLRSLDIDVVADRPGVGRNLMEHPTISISAHMAREARLPATLRRHIHVALRYSSGVEECPQGDMYLVAVSKTGWHAVGRQIGSLMTWVNKSYSRGTVSIVNRDPATEPRVEFAMLSDPRDAQRLMDGMRLIARLYQTEPMMSIASHPFPTSYTERIRDLGVVNLRNRISTDVLANLLDGPTALRRLLIDRLVTEGDTLETLMADEDKLESFVRSKVHGVWHAAGTCRMGTADDPYSVVDARGQVLGVEGLRVADASIMPTIPRANTNLPTIMIGDRMGRLILSGE
jgi:5-(hydroxymethyl)furfural/furfural oxidase